MHPCICISAGADACDWPQLDWLVCLVTSRVDACRTHSTWWQLHFHSCASNERVLFFQISSLRSAVYEYLYLFMNRPDMTCCRDCLQNYRIRFSKRYDSLVLVFFLIDLWSVVCFSKLPFTSVLLQFIIVLAIMVCKKRFMLRSKNTVKMYSWL